jgi:transposase
MKNNVADQAIPTSFLTASGALEDGLRLGGETLAQAMTIIETAKMNGLDPHRRRLALADRQ